MNKWQHLVRLAEGELQAFLSELPPPLRSKAQSVEVVFERRPSRAMLREGMEPDLMGLFEGASLAEPEGEGDPLPPRILLYLDNIWEESEHRDDTYREEVRLTLLHELGHWLGLDEEGLVERELE